MMDLPCDARIDHLSDIRKDAFPKVSHLEMDGIQATDVNNKDNNEELKLFPRHLKDFLDKNHRVICDRIKSVANGTKCVVFAKSALKDSVFDMWIFRSRQPTLFLTFSINDTSEGEYCTHNTNIAEITKTEVMARTQLDFSLINAVIDKDMSACKDRFQEQMLQMTFTPGSSSLLENFETVVKTFMDIVSTKFEDAAEEPKPLVRCLVVSSELNKLEKHVELLQQNDFDTHSLCCTDTNDLTSIDMKAYHRLDLLVDSHMCILLKSGQRLKDNVLKTFSEHHDAEIVLFNLFSPEDNGDDFNEVFFDIPREIRKRPTESVYHHLLPPHDKKKTTDMPTIKSVQVGYKNKITINSLSRQKVLVYQRGTSNVLNIVAPNEQSQLNITTKTCPDHPDAEERIITVMRRRAEHGEITTSGVSSSTIETGSIVIKLNLEPGQLVTDQWLTTVLQDLFTDEVCSLIPDGVTLDLDIDGTVVVSVEDLTKLSVEGLTKLSAEDLTKLLLDPKLHENCVSRFKYDELRRENENLRKKTAHWDSDNISAWMDQATVTTSSGYYTGSVASSVYDYGEEPEDITSYAENTYLSQEAAGCIKCEEVCKAYSELLEWGTLLVMHVHVNIMAPMGGKTRKDKKKFVTQLTKYAASLLNTNGGTILIHIEGKHSEDANLGPLHELITKPLLDLLPDGQSYAQTYRVCNRYDYFGTSYDIYHDVVALKINKIQGVATCDFNTKVRNDLEITSPSSYFIMSMLTEAAESHEQPHIRGLSMHPSQFQENRHIVMKRCHFRHDELYNLLEYIWSFYKLKDCITSFAKLTGGGSYYLGVAEKPVKYKGYKSKMFSIEGFLMHQHEDVIKTELYEKVKNEMCVLDKSTMTFCDVPDDLIKIAIHPVSSGTDSKVVMEVAIRYYDGIVFHDKQGPLTYKVKDGKIQRIERYEWLQRLRQNPLYTF